MNKKILFSNSRRCQPLKLLKAIIDQATYISCQKSRQIKYFEIIPVSARVPLNAYINWQNCTHWKRSVDTTGACLTMCERLSEHRLLVACMRAFSHSFYSYHIHWPDSQFEKSALPHVLYGFLCCYSIAHMYGIYWWWWRQLLAYGCVLLCSCYALHCTRVDATYCSEKLALHLPTHYYHNILHHA